MYKHILAPIDGSDAARRGLQEAIALALDLGVAAEHQMANAAAAVRAYHDEVAIGPIRLRDVVRTSPVPVLLARPAE